MDGAGVNGRATDPSARGVTVTEEAGGLLRLYRPATPNGVGLVWAHGGAFVLGGPDMPESDWVARGVAAQGVTVAALDYRLAPNVSGRISDLPASTRPRAPFPAASDDALVAWSWFQEHARELGVDAARIAIGGASAGANVAAGAALRLTSPVPVTADGMMPDAALPVSPALVVLAYPTLLARQPVPGPELRAALDADPEADRFGPVAVEAMYRDYLAGEVDGAPAAAVPGTATTVQLSAFPETLIVTSEVDELRLSGEDFARRLAVAGRDVRIVTEPGTQHGHLNRPELPAAARSLGRIVSRLAGLA